MLGAKGLAAWKESVQFSRYDSGEWDTSWGGANQQQYRYRYRFYFARREVPTTITGAGSEQNKHSNEGRGEMPGGKPGSGLKPGRRPAVGGPHGSITSLQS